MKRRPQRAPTRRLAAPEPPTAGKTTDEKLSLERFASKVFELRTARGMSQSDLARAVWGEMTLSSGRKAARNRDRISSYEMGKGFPDPHNLVALAKALGVTTAELAPDITGSTVERQYPELAMTSIAGHADKVMLRINKLVSLQIANRIITLLTDPASIIESEGIQPGVNTRTNWDPTRKVLNTDN